MKRLFSLIFLISLLFTPCAYAIDSALILLAAADAHAGVVMHVLGAELTCTDNAIDCSTATGRASYSISSTPNQNYQEIEAQGAEITICQIDMTLCFTTGQTGGDLHLEVWNEGDTTQYGSDSSSETINNENTQVEYNFTFATNPVVPNVDFHIILVEEGGALRVWATSVETCYDGTDYEARIANNLLDRDIIFTIHTMQ